MAQTIKCVECGNSLGKLQTGIFNDMGGIVKDMPVTVVCSCGVENLVN